MIWGLAIAASRVKVDLVEGRHGHACGSGGGARERQTRTAGIRRTRCSGGVGSSWVVQNEVEESKDSALADFGMSRIKKA